MFSIVYFKHFTLVFENKTIFLQVHQDGNVKEIEKKVTYQSYILQFFSLYTFFLFCMWIRISQMFSLFIYLFIIIDKRKTKTKFTCTLKLKYQNK